MTDSAEAQKQSPLEERLIDLIKLKGPITIADYMADALGHPHDGYYMTQTAIGADGDFTTAPEISQIFGELIGLWLVEAWRNIGSPQAFNLIELGPGRGSLMADILRAARLRPEFVRSAQVWLLEQSGLLRHEQQKRLRGSEVKPLWADSFEDIPAAPSLIIANEFFDCLPIRQFKQVGGSWREQLVGLSDDSSSLELVLGKTPPPAEYDLPAAADCSEGDVFEKSFAAQEVLTDICSLFSEHKSAALIIDYGHMQSGLGDTLQAVRNHKYWPPLSAPGLADVTAHVDFEAISNTAIQQGAMAFGPVAQGVFLERLGLNLRVEMLCKGKSAADADLIRAGAARIAAPDQMGEIFKAVSITSPALGTPPGFSDL